VDRFAEAGGVIGLYNIDNNVQFSNQPGTGPQRFAANQFSALKLAKIVRRDAREDGQ